MKYFNENFLFEGYKWLLSQNQRVRTVAFKNLSKLDISHILAYTYLDKLYAWCRSSSGGGIKPLKHTRFFKRAYFALQKTKTIRSTSFRVNKPNIEKVTLNSKYYHDHQPTCNILIKFTYLMASELLYLLMDWEIFN